MKKVGIRELKENLSKYLKKTRESGEKIIVTDRKKEIAMIVPYESLEEEKKIIQLKAKGIVEWSGKKPKDVDKRIHIKGKKVSDIVLEDRR